MTIVTDGAPLDFIPRVSRGIYQSRAEIPANGVGGGMAAADSAVPPCGEG